MEKCFNIDCEDNDAEKENGCYFVSTSDCIGFVSKEQWKEKMVGLGLSKEVKMQDENKKGGLPPNATGGNRMGARGVLQDKIKRCRKELDALEFLDRTVDWEGLPSKDEQLLWYYFTSH